MNIEQTKDEIIIHLPKKAYSKRLQKIIDLLNYKSVISKSKASDRAFDAFLEQVKSERRATILAGKGKLK